MKVPTVSACAQHAAQVMQLNLKLNSSYLLLQLQRV
jgi:hypothetical protein